MKEDFKAYIAKINGLNGVRLNKSTPLLSKEYKLQGNKLKAEKILNISLILNAVLSLGVVLLSITIFAIMVYGTIGIYD